MITKFKLFESSTNLFKKGDIVKYNNDIYYVQAQSISNSGNTSLLYLYDDHIKYEKNLIEEIDGIGWIDNDKLEKLSEEEMSAIKYNL